MEAKHVARFWAAVDKNGPVVREDLGPCWLWTSTVNSNGYGQLVIGKKKNATHRIAWLLETGTLPPCVCHKCDVRHCCNPSHLFSGSQADNVKDMWAKHRESPPPVSATRGEDHPPSKITERQAAEIIERGFAGESNESLGEEFGIHKSTVGAILRGISWAHLPRPQIRTVNGRWGRRVVSR